MKYLGVFYVKTLVFIFTERTQIAKWLQIGIGITFLSGYAVSPLFNSAVNKPGEKRPRLFTLEEAVKLCEWSLIRLDEAYIW